MPTDLVTTPIPGQATKVSDYVRLRDAIKGVSQAHHFLGGDLNEYVTATAFVDVPQALEFELDGTHLPGLSVFFAVNVQGLVNAVTATMRLFNITAGGAVASSTVAVVLAAAGVRTYSKSSALTLATGVNRYKAQIQTSDLAKAVSGAAFINIRG